MQKFIMQEDIPRWYSMYWNNGLFFDIHRQFLERAEYVDFGHAFQSRVKGDRQELFDSIEPVVGRETFGINQALVLEKQNANWLTYKVNIPLIRLFSGIVCERCSGTRFDNGRECIYCSGTGRQEIVNYDLLNDLALSLNALLACLNFPPEKDVDSDQKQLFTITSCYGVGSHSHSVGGYASPVFRTLLLKASQSKQVAMKLTASVEDAMKQAYKLMHGCIEKYNRQCFRCLLDDGHVNLSCPGNACEIHTVRDWVTVDGYGVEITCHNLDSAVQQVTLLSGLARLASCLDSLKV